MPNLKYIQEKIQKGKGNHEKVSRNLKKNSI